MFTTKMKMLTSRLAMVAVVALVSACATSPTAEVLDGVAEAADVPSDEAADHIVLHEDRYRLGPECRRAAELLPC